MGDEIEVTVALNGPDEYRAYNDAPVCLRELIYRQARELAEAAAAMPSGWQPIESAPFSVPAAQAYFLAYCPNDDWAPMGSIHTACRYAHDAVDEVRVYGSPQPRRATHWMLPEPPK